MSILATTALEKISDLRSKAQRPSARPLWLRNRMASNQAGDCRPGACASRDRHELVGHLSRDGDPADERASVREEGRAAHQTRSGVLSLPTVPTGLPTVLPTVPTWGFQPF